MRPVREPIHVLAVGVDIGEIDGASVEAAEDLLGALARLADGGIDVVLLSLELPDGQGDDAVRSVRERAPDVPLIAVADGAWEHRAREAGAADVVPTDGGPELVARAIRYAVALHRMGTELRRREIVDADTGLYNARGLEAFASHHFALVERSRQPLVLLSIRIDGPDGREDAADAADAGDADDRSGSLAETADVLRAAVRDCDVLARTGEASFCALLTGDAVGAESLVLARMVDALAVRNARSRPGRSLALSIGAATYEPGRPVTLQELIAEAERGGEVER
jgi:diguanylate cyclase (GGDEF)-like protein